MTEALDMSQFIEAKSDQLNSDDLIGRSITVTVTKVTGSEGEQPIAIHFEGDNGKPFKPCKTIRRVLVAVWGRYANDYVGRSMTLYRDDAVTFGGLQVGGIRISHMSHLEKEIIVVVAKSKGKKAGMNILPLVDAPKTEDPAARFANAYIAKLASFATPIDLGAFVDSKAAKLAELKTARPDLHGKVTAAIEARANDLAPAASGFDDDDLDDTPTKPGETILDALDDAHPAEDKASAIIDEIKAAISIMDINSIESRTKADVDAMPEDIGAGVRQVIEARKSEIKAERAEASA